MKKLSLLITTLFFLNSNISPEKIYEHKTYDKNTGLIKCINTEPFKENLLFIRFSKECDFDLLFQDLFIKQEYYFKTNNTEPFIIDCGSHIGMSILYFKDLYPKARMIGFEPYPKTFEILKENIEKNHLENVTLINKALSNENSTINFYFEEDNDSGNTLFPLWNKQCEHIPCVKLSDYIHQEIDLLKIDVEGAEGLIIEDLIANNKLKFVKQIVMEYHTFISHAYKIFEVPSLLEKNGFNIQLKKQTHLGGQPYILTATQKN